MAKRSK